MTTKPPYRPLPVYEDAAEVETILATGSWSDLMKLPLALGMSWPDWRYVQTICLRLAENEDAAIRANACIGLSYLALNHRQLDEELVRPILLRELETQPAEFRPRIEWAISEVDAYLDWNLAPN